MKKYVVPVESYSRVAGILICKSNNFDYSVPKHPPSEQIRLYIKINKSNIIRFYPYTNPENQPLHLSTNRLQQIKIIQLVIVTDNVTFNLGTINPSYKVFNGSGSE